MLASPVVGLFVLWGYEPRIFYLVDLSCACMYFCCFVNLCTRLSPWPVVRVVLSCHAYIYILYILSDSIHSVVCSMFILLYAGYYVPCSASVISCSYCIFRALYILHTLF